MNKKEELFSGSESRSKEAGKQSELSTQTPQANVDMKGEVLMKLKEINGVIKPLLKFDKTIRDPVHIDIMLSKFELEIIDTPEFQRLHKIKELGTAYMVYPGATHTRFLHSLGTLYMAQYLLEKVLSNPFKDPMFFFCVDTPTFSFFSDEESWTEDKIVITNYHVLLTRITALIHDLAHIPFGHTLEDEGFLFAKQWADINRLRYFLTGENSTLRKVILRFLKDNNFDSLNKYGLNSEKFLEDIKSILLSKDEDLEKLEYPFISDIIHNTICADLLDYTKRDAFFCGLGKTYDIRFLFYFYLGMYNNKPRMLLRLRKPLTDELKRSVLSETLNLLRLRYSLAENVNYHPAKIKASAMLISATQHFLKNKKDFEKSLLYKIGDDEFVSMLKSDETAAKIIEKLDKREFYENVYMLNYRKKQEKDTLSKDGRSDYKKFEDNILPFIGHPDRRYKYERILEKRNSLELGKVIIYCPEIDMGRKALKTLADPGKGFKPNHLDMIEDSELKNEIETITERHLSLWHFYVYIDPSLDLEIKKNIVCDCLNLFELGNENSKYQDLECRPYEDRLKERAEKETGKTISQKKHNEILEIFASSKRSWGEENLGVIPYSQYLEKYRNVKE